MGREHTDQKYEGELRRLREQVLRMGAKVEEMIAASVRALAERDSGLARRMVDFDRHINRLEMETDELCFRILARRQPVASDLRFITTALKLVTDLERIGDLCVNTCERVIELNQEPPLNPYVELLNMAEVVRAMVGEALDAFVAGDGDRAEAVIARDVVVDAYYGQIFRTLLTYMMEDPRNIYRATRVQSIAKYLERTGDHATNLAEMVVFMVKGKDIRHAGRLHPAGAGAPPPATDGLPRHLLFVSVRNGARSQMAEGWARKLLPPTVRVDSAGYQPGTLNRRAVSVMNEAGIDISAYRPKALAEIPLAEVDRVIILAPEVASLPLPIIQRETWALPDPELFTGSEQEIEAAFRRLRDDLRVQIEALASVPLARQA